MNPDTRPNANGRDRARCGHATLLVICLICVVGTSGCTRRLYRQRADAEAYCLIGTKSGDARWALDDYSIQTDPASRMFDPDNLDRPPMPPDDPTAHRLMHCVDGKRGSKLWHVDGDTPYVENPAWRDFLPIEADGGVRVDADSVMRLGLLHSSRYQSSLEELYLSALDVSFERFRFDTQFFGGLGVFFTSDGPARRTGGGESRSALELTTNTQNGNWNAQRLFATGGELAVGLANAVVWQFSGPDDQSAVSLLDFSLIQPLLRGAGRAVVLERLTIAERALLSNVRQMFRFRQSYYLELITGQNAQSGVSRRGGVLGGSGLQGFSGVGGGGFGRLGGFNNNGGNFGNGLQFGAGAGQAGGFLGLLQSQQNIRNQRANIAALRSSVSQLEAFFLAGRIDYFQVELARQALYEGQSRLLNAEQDYQGSLDRYKATLGLPPSVNLIIDDRFIQPFQLIDANLVKLQNQLTATQEAIGKQIIAMLEAAKAARNEAESTEEPPHASPPEGATPASPEPARGDSEEGPAPVDQTPANEPTVTTASAVEVADALYPSTAHRTIPAVRLVAELRDQVTGGLKWSDELAASLQALAQQIAAIAEIADDSREAVTVVREDVRSLQSHIADRTQNGERLQSTVYPRLKAILETLPSEPEDGPTDGSEASPTGKTGEKTATDSSDPKAETPPNLPTSSDANPLKSEASKSTPTPPIANAGAELFPYDAERLKKLPSQLAKSIDELEIQFKDQAGKLRSVAQEIDALLKEGPALDEGALLARAREKVLLPIPTISNDLAANLLSLTLVQAQARTEAITLVPVDMTWEVALEIARVNRLDWMNARANLVDTWRLIRFNANALKSQLDLVFSGDISNTGDNPFRLRSSTGRLRVGMRFDAPLTRLSERNQYRQALIEYQQARRSFYEFEDAIARDLRASLRSLDVNQVNFEFRRAAVDVAIAQVELARLRLQEPPRPDAVAQFGNTTARDLVSALTDLLNVQNDFLSVWINHEALRRSMDLSLGTMQLDAAGIWMDPGPLSDDMAPTPMPMMLEEGNVDDRAEENAAPIGEDGAEELPSPLLEERAKIMERLYRQPRLARLPVPPSPE